MESLWSPPNNPVFELTSPSFDAYVRRLYAVIGSPTLTYNSIWTIYGELKARLEQEMQAEDREQVLTEFNSLEANFEQDLQPVADAEVGKDVEESDDPFFDDRLFSDDEDEIDREDVEMEIVLSEEEDEDEVEDLLTEAQD